MRQLTQWQAEDGTVFGSPDACARYEALERLRPAAKRAAEAYGYGEKEIMTVFAHLLRNGYEIREVRP